MSEYRRWWMPGGTYFFTVVTEQRQPIFNDPAAIDLMRDVVRRVLTKHPFEIVAWVVLPDHLHAIWTLPDHDHAYDLRWSLIKRRFTNRWLASGGVEMNVRPGRRSYRGRGVWQRRYWEHCLDGDDDFENHFDYVHYNPAKHGLVERPIDWLPSTFHRYVKLGWYPPDWGVGPKPARLVNFKVVGE